MPTATYPLVGGGVEGPPGHVLKYVQVQWGSLVVK
jgi:hypothetical protein